MAAYGATVVAGFYKQGKLGSKATVEHQLEAWGPVGSGKTFFDRRGGLIPFGKLSEAQQTAFRHWMYGAHVDAVTDVHAEILAHRSQINAECE
jgi:hypothetical protein